MSHNLKVKNVILINVLIYMTWTLRLNNTFLI